MAPVRHQGQRRHGRVRRLLRARSDCVPRRGAPWFPTAKGSGHLWPILDGERAEQDLQTGSACAAGSLLRAMQSMTSGLGMVPEQAWEDPAVAASPYGSDPATASIGFANGKPAGSASPLIWAQAQYLRLVTDLGSGIAGRPAGIVADRYVRHAPPGVLPVAVTATVSGARSRSAERPGPGAPW
jgi:glucoamylase